MANGILGTNTDILQVEVNRDYSGASGIFVDNVNNIISITGDVGKVYSGIDPIVVNNEENLISANSAPIGVQEPLYFVQDNPEGVIIGLSGDFVSQSSLSGYLPSSSFFSYTDYADLRMSGINNLANSAYNLSLYNFNNKLDISAYSATSGLFPFTGTDNNGYNYTANANCSSFEFIKNKDLEVENVKLFSSGFNYIDNQNDLNVSWSSLKDIPSQLATLSSHDNAIVNSNRTEYYIGRNNRMRVTTGFNYDYASKPPKIETYDGDIENGWWSPAGGPCFSTANVVTSDKIRVGGKGSLGSAYSGEYTRLEFLKRGAYLVNVTTPFKITSPGTNGGQYYINFLFNVHSGEGSTYRNKLVNRALVCEYADTWTLPVIITGTSGYLNVGAELYHTSAASANDGFSGVFGRMIPHAVRVGDSITSPYVMPWSV